MHVVYMYVMIVFHRCVTLIYHRRLQTTCMQACCMYVSQNGHRFDERNPLFFFSSLLLLSPPVIYLDVCIDGGIDRQTCLERCPLSTKHLCTYFVLHNLFSSFGVRIDLDTKHFPRENPRHLTHHAYAAAAAAAVDELPTQRALRDGWFGLLWCLDRPTDCLPLLPCCRRYLLCSK